MFDKFLRLLRSMELEEKILHAGTIFCLLSLFMPWLGGQWYGNTQQWNGFGFHTGFIGHEVFALQFFIMTMTLSPLFGGPILVRKSKRNFVRLLLSTLSTVLLISAFSVLLRFISEASGAEIRFGIYLSIIGSAVTTLYAFLRYQEDAQAQGKALFHHPDHMMMTSTQKPKPKLEELLPPPPPPPTPPPLEEHRIYKSS
jgi:hypothetical protein